jgi:hypothetical protein
MAKAMLSLLIGTTGLFSTAFITDRFMQELGRHVFREVIAHDPFILRRLPSCETSLLR